MQGVLCILIKSAQQQFQAGKRKEIDVDKTGEHLSGLGLFAGLRSCRARVARILDSTSIFYQPDGRRQRPTATFFSIASLCMSSSRTFVHWMMDGSFLADEWSILKGKLASSASRLRNGRISKHQWGLRSGMTIEAMFGGRDLCAMDKNSTTSQMAYPVLSGGPCLDQGSTYVQPITGIHNWHGHARRRDS